MQWRWLRRNQWYILRSPLIRPLSPIQWPLGSRCYSSSTLSVSSPTEDAVPMANESVQNLFQRCYATLSPSIDVGPVRRPRLQGFLTCSIVEDVVEIIIGQGAIGTRSDAVHRAVQQEAVAIARLIEQSTGLSISHYMRKSVSRKDAPLLGLLREQDLILRLHLSVRDVEELSGDKMTSTSEDTANGAATSKMVWTCSAALMDSWEPEPRYRSVVMHSSTDVSAVLTAVLGEVEKDARRRRLVCLMSSLREARQYIAEVRECHDEAVLMRVCASSLSSAASIIHPRGTLALDCRCYSDAVTRRAVALMVRLYNAVPHPSVTASSNMLLQYIGLCPAFNADASLCFTNTDSMNDPIGAEDVTRWSAALMRMSSAVAATPPGAEETIIVEDWSFAPMDALRHIIEACVASSPSIAWDMYASPSLSTAAGRPLPPCGATPLLAHSHCRMRQPPVSTSCFNLIRYAGRLAVQAWMLAQLDCAAETAPSMLLPPLYPSLLHQSTELDWLGLRAALTYEMGLRHCPWQQLSGDSCDQMYGLSYRADVAVNLTTEEIFASSKMYANASDVAAQLVPWLLDSTGLCSILQGTLLPSTASSDSAGTSTDSLPSPRKVRVRRRERSLKSQKPEETDASPESMVLTTTSIAGSLRSVGIVSASYDSARHRLLCHTDTKQNHLIFSAMDTVKGVTRLIRYCQHKGDHVVVYIRRKAKPVSVVLRILQAIMEEAPSASRGCKQKLIPQGTTINYFGVAVPLPLTQDYAYISNTNALCRDHTCRKLLSVLQHYSEKPEEWAALSQYFAPLNILAYWQLTRDWMAPSGPFRWSLRQTTPPSLSGLSDGGEGPFGVVANSVVLKIPSDGERDCDRLVPLPAGHAFLESLYAEIRKAAIDWAAQPHLSATSTATPTPAANEEQRISFEGLRYRIILQHPSLSSAVEALLLPFTFTTTRVMTPCSMIDRIFGSLSFFEREENNRKGRLCLSVSPTAFLILHEMPLQEQLSATQETRWRERLAEEYLSKHLGNVAAVTERVAELCSRMRSYEKKLQQGCASSSASPRLRCTIFVESGGNGESTSAGARAAPEQVVRVEVHHTRGLKTSPTETEESLLLGARDLSMVVALTTTIDALQTSLDQISEDSIANSSKPEATAASTGETISAEEDEILSGEAKEAFLDAAVRQLRHSLTLAEVWHDYDAEKEQLLICGRRSSDSSTQPPPSSSSSSSCIILAIQQTPWNDIPRYLFYMYRSLIATQHYTTPAAELPGNENLPLRRMDTLTLSLLFSYATSTLGWSAVMSEVLVCTLLGGKWISCLTIPAQFFFPANQAHLRQYCPHPLTSSFVLSVSCRHKKQSCRLLLCNFLLWVRSATYWNGIEGLPAATSAATKNDSVVARMDAEAVSRRRKCSTHPVFHQKQRCIEAMNRSPSRPAVASSTAVPPRNGSVLQSLLREVDSCLQTIVDFDGSAVLRLRHGSGIEIIYAMKVADDKTPSGGGDGKREDEDVVHLRSEAWDPNLWPPFQVLRLVHDVLAYLRGSLSHHDDANTSAAFLVLPPVSRSLPPPSSSSAARRKNFCVWFFQSYFGWRVCEAEDLPILQITRASDVVVVMGSAVPESNAGSPSTSTLAVSLELTQVKAGPASLTCFSRTIARGVGCTAEEAMDDAWIKCAGLLASSFHLSPESSMQLLHREVMATLTRPR